MKQIFHRISKTAKLNQLRPKNLQKTETGGQKLHKTN